MSWQLAATVMTGIVCLTVMLCTGLMAEAYKHVNGPHGRDE